MNEQVMETPTGPGVRIVGKKFRPNYFLALVTDPEAGNEIEVRVDLARPKPYRCRTHGPQATPSCVHSILAHALIVTREKINPGGALTIPHSRSCKKPVPVLRLSWKRTPEFWCPGCGRSCPAPDERG